jgi:hypothetical protein
VNRYGQKIIQRVDANYINAGAIRQIDTLDEEWEKGIGISASNVMLPEK